VEFRRMVFFLTRSLQADGDDSDSRLEWRWKCIWEYLLWFM